MNGARQSELSTASPPQNGAKRSKLSSEATPQNLAKQSKLSSGLRRRIERVEVPQKLRFTVPEVVIADCTDKETRRNSPEPEHASDNEFS